MRSFWMFYNKLHDIDTEENDNHNYNQSTLKKYFFYLLHILQCDSNELNINKFNKYVLKNYNSFKTYANQKVALSALNYMKYLLDSYMHNIHTNSSRLCNRNKNNSKIKKKKKKKQIQKKKKHFYKFKDSLSRIGKQKSNHKKYNMVCAPNKLVKSKSASMRIPYPSLNYNLSASPMSILRQHQSFRFNNNKNNHKKAQNQNDSLDSLVPILQSKLSFELPRMCNINQRTKYCYFIVDNIQLHQKSVRIYMDLHLNEKLRQNNNNENKLSKENNIENKNMVNAWNMISVIKNGNKQMNDENNNLLFGLKTEFRHKNVNKNKKMPFELNKCVFFSRDTAIYQMTLTVLLNLYLIAQQANIQHSHVI